MERARIPSRFRTVSAESDVGLNLTDREIMTQAEVQSLTCNQLSHPGAPPPAMFKKNYTMILKKKCTITKWDLF